VKDFYGVFVRFSTTCTTTDKGDSKTQLKKKNGGSLCQKLFAKKVEKKQLFSCRFSPSIFLNCVFGRFSA
jgi:hypothetical protein